MKTTKSKVLISAFSMIELIFIIIVIGILGSALTMIMPDNTLLNDKNFIIQKIKSVKLNAFNIDHTILGENSWRSKDYITNYENNTTCMELSKNYFDTLESNGKSTKKYKLSIRTILTTSNSISKICFDSIGRVYKDDYQLNNFLKMPIELNITYKGKIKELLIMPYSGAIISKR